MRSIPIYPVTASAAAAPALTVQREGLLARLGLGMRRHQRLIMGIQCEAVVVYFG